MMTDLTVYYSLQEPYSKIHSIIFPLFAFQYFQRTLTSSSLIVFYIF